MQLVMARDEALSPIVIERIWRMMEQRQMSQQDVVNRATALGGNLGKATLNRILHGKANARYSTLSEIARALGADVRALTEESAGSIPEPDRWASVLFVPVAHYYDSAFHLDPAGAKVPTSDMPAGARYVTFVLEGDVGMSPEIGAGDRLFVDVTPQRIERGEVVVIPDYVSGDPENRIWLGRVIKTDGKVDALDNTGANNSVATEHVLGVVRRVCRENLTRQTVSVIGTVTRRRR